MELGSIAEWDFFRWFFEDDFSRDGHQIDIRFGASSALGILGLVGSGLGVPVCAEGIARFLPRMIVTNSIADCDAAISTLLCWNRAYATPAPRNFVEIAKAYANSAP